MAHYFARRMAPAIVALGIVSGSLGLSSAAFASTHAPTVKAGSSCTKAELNKTVKVGKTTYICKKVGHSYKWEKK